MISKIHGGLFLSFFLFASQAFSQFSVSGIVCEKDTRIGIPGVSVVEKNTNTGTVTDVNGKFTINVSNQNSTLVFSGVGLKNQEISLEGSDYLTIELKLDAICCFFDAKNIHFSLLSGVLNNPIGGELQLNMPAFGQVPLIYKIAYQTNFSQNHALQASSRT